MDRRRETFETILQEKGLVLSGFEANSFSFECIAFYYDYLLKAEEEISLFSRNDAPRILERHLYESLVFVSTVSERLGVSHETKVIDVGSGAGLPGYLFHCLKEKPGLSLLDSSRRKLGHLEEKILQEIEGSPREQIPQFLYQRVEEIQGEYDLAVARAFAPFPFIVELIFPILNMGGWLAVSAGPFDDSEFKDHEKYLNDLGVVSRETLPLPRLNFLGTRNIILLQRGRKMGRGYPRPWKLLKEEIKKWQKSSQ